MKKFFKTLIFSLLLVLSCSYLVACNNSTVDFKIKFMVNDAEYHSITTSGNARIELPENPTLEGFVFDGWYWDKDTWEKPFTAISLLNEPLSKDMKVYAKWITDNTPKNTEAVFKDFSKISNHTYSISVSNTTENIVLSEFIEVSNKSSWILTTDIQALNSIPSKIASLSVGDNTYYVLVTSQSNEVKLYTLQIRRRPMYTVNFNSNGGTPINSVAIEENCFVQVPEIVPVKAGYTFECWDFDFGQPIISNTNITAIYLENTNKLFFYGNGHTSGSMDYIEAKTNDRITLPHNQYKKDFYEFSHWDTYNSSYMNNSQYIVGTQSEVYFYAIWKPVNYSITIITDGGTKPTEQTSYNIETKTILLNDSYKEGYTFNGWYTDLQDIDTKVTEIPKGSHGNITLYAKFTPTEHDIVYELNGGVNNIDNPKTFNIESGILQFEAPTKSECIFGGWFIDNEFTTKEIKSLEITTLKPIKLYAKWFDSTYTPISNFIELQNIKNDLSGNYYLTNNIVLEDDQIWETIANTSESPFSGVIDGCSYYISNLTTMFLGYNNGSIRNLSLLNVEISSGFSNSYGFSTASLVMYNYGNIINCHTQGKIIASGDTSIQVGGMVFVNSSPGVVLNCVSEISIKVGLGVMESGKSYFVAIGGLCYSTSSNIYNSYTTGDISLSVHYPYIYDYDTRVRALVGGLVLSADETLDQAVKNCFSASNINCSINYGTLIVSGLCASGSINSFSNCFVDNDITVDIKGRGSSSVTEPTIFYNQLIYDLRSGYRDENGYIEYGNKNYVIGNKKLIIEDEIISNNEKIIPFDKIADLMEFLSVYFDFYNDKYPRLKIFNQ